MGYMGIQPSIYKVSKILSVQLRSDTVVPPEMIWTTSGIASQWLMYDQLNIDENDCWVSAVNNSLSIDPEISLRLNTSDSEMKRLTMYTRNTETPALELTPVSFDLVYTEDIIPEVYDATILRALNYTVVESFVDVAYGPNEFISFEAFADKFPVGCKWGIRVTKASGANNQVAIGTLDGYDLKTTEVGQYSTVKDLTVSGTTTIDEFNGSFLYDTQTHKVPTQKAIIDMINTRYIGDVYTIQYFSSPIVECPILDGTDTPYFIRIDELTNKITVLASPTDMLSVSIEKSRYELTEEKVLENLIVQETGLDFLSNDISLDGTEETTYLTEFFIATPTAGCVRFNRRPIAFRSKLAPASIMYGILELDTNKVTNIRTRHWFDYQDQPITPVPLNNADSFEILEMNWIFMDVNKNITTKSEPIYMEYNRPITPVDNSVWFNSELGKWEHYTTLDGWVDYKSELIGYVVMDETKPVGSRCLDKRYNLNDIDQTTFEVGATNTVETIGSNMCVSVYTRFLTINPGNLQWVLSPYNENIPYGSLETGITVELDTWYYMYIGTKYETYLSTIRPKALDLSEQLFHPFNTWRCIGRCYNNEIGTITTIEKI